MAKWFYTIPLRVRSLFRRRNVELELDDEIRHHIERQIEQHIAAGMKPDDARYAALRAFGGVEQHKEVVRDTRRVTLIEDICKDLRYAVRQLLRTPVLTLAVVLSLALGIGANTAIFTAIDAVMLRTLPVQNPGRLVMLTWSAREQPRAFVSDLLGGGFIPDGAPIRGVRSFSRAAFEYVRDRNQVFSSTFAVAGNNQEVNAQTAQGARSATMQGVSGNYFEALGVSALVGRALIEADDRDSEPPVAVVSYGFWKNKLGGDASAIGRTLIVNGGGNPITIVGVTPPNFSGLAPGTLPDLWVPLSFYMSQPAFSPASRSQIGDTPPTAFPYWNRPTTWWLQVFGRLRPGVMEAQARTEVQALFHQSLQASAPAAAVSHEMPGLDLFNVKHGLAGLRDEYSTALFLMMGVVSLVLMIACGNVTTLLLARATTRQREIAVRLSLGASRWRLIRQLLTESILLSVTGGTLGLVVAIWADEMLVGLLSSGRSPLNIELRLDAAVFVFTAGLSLLTGVLFGVLPALRATRVELIGAIRQGASRTSTESRFQTGKLVVAAQVALCLVLVSSAGLLLRTLGNLHSIDAGFDPQHVLLFAVRPGLNGYKEGQLAGYYQNLKQRIESIPGVRSVSLSTRGPVGQGVGNSGVFIPGYMTGQDVGVNRHQVGPDYFETLGIPIVVGRGIRAEDRQGAPGVVVVNERLVREFFHGDNPIGRHIRLGPATNSPDFEVVGVARDVKYNRMQDDAPPTTYYSYLQFLFIPNSMVFEVRATPDLASLVVPIQREAALLDPSVPVADVKTEVQLIEQTFVLERTFATLSTAFGALALLLVAIGLYGTIAYTVTRQTKEIGIRMALGARRDMILAGVMKRTAAILVGGLGCGLILTLAVTPLLKSYMFGLAPHDSMTIAACGAVIAGIALAAGFLPARRAARIDPMISLREE